MAQTKVKLISDGVIVQSNLHVSHGITTADIGEGSNLYYTDARVGSYLSTNGYATQTDIVAAITDSAPVTLDTLNELAAALGDDPNFATTTATSLGLKAPLASPSFTGNATFAGTVTAGRNLDLSSTDYTYLQGTHTGAGDGDYLMRTFGYGDSTFYGSFDILRHDTDDGELRLRQRIAGTATDVMTIVDGNVGIGTTSPSQVLDVNGNIKVRGVSATKEGMIHNSGSYFSLVSTGDTSDTTGARIWLGNNSSASAYYQNASVHNFRDLSSNIKMIINSSGNVGIGTTLPKRPLQIGATNQFPISFNGNYPDIHFNTYYENGWRIHTAGFGAKTTFNGATGAWVFSNVASAQSAAATFTPLDRFAILANGNVGIGTTSPKTTLDITGSGNTAINSKGNLLVSSGGTATQAAETGGQISFGSWLNGDLTQPYPVAAIRGVAETSTTNNNRGALIFGTMDDNTAVQERMRITSGGLVSLPTTGLNDTRHIIFTGTQANNDNAGALGMWGNEVRLSSNWYYNGAHRKTVSGNGMAVIGLGTGNTDATTYLTFGTATTTATGGPIERMRIDSNGSIGMGANSSSYRLRIKTDATVTNGVYLSAGTGNGNHALYVEDKDGTAEYFAVRGDGEIRLNASSGHTYAAQGIRFGTNASANKLDDYEEGTWTPAVSGSTTAGTATYGSQGGSYTKIGNKVTCWFSITNFAQSGATGNFTITGLPFTCITTSVVRGCFSSNLRFYNMPFPGDVPVISLSDGNNSFIILWSRNNTTWIGQSVVNSGNQYIEGYVTYSTA
jgi:hypothetical protein